MVTMPTASPSLMACALRVEVVNAYPARPKGSEFARLITSSSALKRTMPATGPKGSSVIMRLSSGSSVMTVGAKKLPSPPIALPPVSTVAPRSLASSTKLATAAKRRRWASGPMRESAAMPSPTFKALVLLTNSATKRSYAPSCT